MILIDAGFPGSRDDVLASLGQLGFGADDLRAILLTHAHIDHFGSAIWFAKTHGTPVYCHADEVGHSKREYLEQASPVDVVAHAWQPRWLKWSVAISRKGAFTRDGIPTTQALTEDVAATLPGAPMAIPSPGHTGGHCSFVVDGVLVSGDALVTGHPTATRTGPQLLHKVFNHDQEGCVRSLAALAMLETDVLVPGHGQVWRGPIREAARSGERFVAQQEDPGQAQTAAHDERRHQDLVVEVGVVRRVAAPAEKGPQPESALQASHRPRQRAATLRSFAKSAPHHTPAVRATAPGQPIGKDDREGCARCIRCGTRRAPAAAVRRGRRSRRGRAG